MPRRRDVIPAAGAFRVYLKYLHKNSTAVVDERTITWYAVPEAILEGTNPMGAE